MSKEELVIVVSRVMSKEETMAHYKKLSRYFHNARLRQLAEKKEATDTTAKTEDLQPVT